MISSHSTVIFILIVTCISLRCSDSFKFPNDFELCHRTDNECIVKRVNTIVNNHPHGYPEIVLLPDVEPIRLEKIEIKGNPESPVNFTMQLSNVEMHGYSNSTFTKFIGFDKDPSKIKVVTESSIPRLVINSKYNISGELIGLPITGEGESTIEMTGLRMKSLSKPAYDVRDGKTFLKVGSYKLDIEADNMQIQMTNLFNGDNEDLSESVLRVMNESWDWLLWDEMSPQFNKAIESANAKIFDYIFGMIPYEDMFLPD